MLPPISSISSARSVQPVKDALVGQISTPIATEADLETPLPADTKTPIQERLTALALSGQLTGGRGVLNVTDMIGSILDIERQPNEALADYADRLLEALKALSPSAQNSVQRALAQWVRSMALDFLMQALRHPDGPEATKLAAQLETLGMDKEVVQRQISAGYAENEEFDLPPNVQRLSVERRSAGVVNLAEQPRVSNLAGPGLPANGPTLRAALTLVTRGNDAALPAAATGLAASSNPVEAAVIAPERGSDHANSGRTSPATAPSGLLALEASGSAESERSDPIYGTGSSANQQASAERLKSETAFENRLQAQPHRSVADAAVVPHADLDDGAKLEAAPNQPEAARVRNSSSSPTVPDRVNPSSDGKDSQIAKALILNGLVFEQLEESMLGGEAIGKPVTRNPVTGLFAGPVAGIAMFEDAEIDTQTLGRLSTGMQQILADKTAAEDASAQYSHAEIIPQPIATLSLTSALLQDESAMAGLAQALVQMRAVIGQAALPPHVLYPADGRGAEDDDDVRVTAVEAEDEDRHQKRRDRGQSGEQQSHDERQDQGQGEGLTADIEKSTSLPPEPADFYHKLGGW